jgi:hypothetical protein
MRRPLTLVVLAAGIGSRYGGLKQVDPMGPNGEIILDYSVHDALAAGFTTVVFVISQEIEEAFRGRIDSTMGPHCETACVVQRLDDLPAGMRVPEGRTKPWGTAHAVLCSRSAVRGPFAVINADDWYGPAAYAALAGHLSGEGGGTQGAPEYCMVGYRLGNTLTEHGHVARGVCEVDDAGFLLSAREYTRIEKSVDGPRCSLDGRNWLPLPAETIVSMNMWGFTPAIYDDIVEHFPRFIAANRTVINTAEFFLPSLVTDLIGEGKARVRVLPTEETWYGVTYAGDKPRVREALQARIAAGDYPSRLWKESS